jgi:hypothetical protein
VRRFLRRGVRLELVRALGIALVLPMLTMAALHAQSVSTTTTLTSQSGASATCPTTGLTVTLTNLTVAVTGTGGVPAGTVTIVDGSGNSAVQLGTATLGLNGQASFVFYLADGPHSLSAVYAGQAPFLTSTSASSPVTISNQCDTGIAVTVSNLAPTTTPPNTLTPGQSGTATVTVVPLESYVAALSGPAFVTLSCSGLPDQAACVFAPENVEILTGQYSGVASTMVITTQIGSQSDAMARPVSTPVALAILLPGALALGGLGWATRRRAWLNRMSLLALVALVTLLGTTACNPRYDYFNHGPVPNRETPAGNYTVIVAAQSSNGVTAITNTTDLALTVTALNATQ